MFVRSLVDARDCWGESTDNHPVPTMVQSRSSCQELVPDVSVELVPMLRSGFKVPVDVAPAANSMAPCQLPSWNPRGVDCSEPRLFTCFCVVRMDVDIGR